MNKNEVLTWQESLATTYQEFTSQIILFFPNLLGALAFLLAGWITALFFKLVAKKLIAGLDVLFVRAIKTGGIRKDSLLRSYAIIISRVVFWVVMIFFIAATTNLLGWNLFTNWVNSIINYLPDLIAGVIIILAGFIIGNVVKTGILKTGRSAGVSQVDMLGRIAYITILVTAIIVGTEQIGINVNFLTSILIVVIGVTLGGGALAFSFGAKCLVANTIAARHVRKHCRIGELIKIREFEGTLAEVTQTSIILDTGSGRTIIPAKTFQEEPSQVSAAKNTVDQAAKPQETGGEK